MEQTLDSHKLSVIIPVWKHHDLAKIHVQECMKSTRIPDEIIVINDGGEDDLEDKLKELEIKTKVIYAKILPPKIPWNYTGARNLGVWLSLGDLISIEDQDHIPQKDFYKLAIEELDKNPDASRCKTCKRWVITEEDVLTKPIEEWVIISSRIAHEDCTVWRREGYLKLKGYDERFAGEYGWCATDMRRRLIRSGMTNCNAGHQYVVFSEKTRGLSYRNFRLSRLQKENQSPTGIINFSYTFKTL